MKQVSRHVFIDPNDGSATVGAIQTSEGVVLVDTPNQPTRAKRLLEEIKSLGPLRYIINTEHHSDHVFGNFFFSGTVVAHRGTKERFWQDSVLGPNSIKDPVKYVKRIDPKGTDLIANYKAREPEIAYEGRLLISIGEVTLELFEVSGHVPIATAVYLLEERVLFTGDQVFNGTMTWYQEALPFEWLQTLERFKGMDIKVVVPGHGDAAGPEVLDEMRRTLEEEIGEVQRAVASGMSRDEAVGRINFLDHRPIPTLHQERATELQRAFVGQLYDRLKERGS